MNLIRKNPFLLIAALALLGFAYFAFAKPALRRNEICDTDKRIGQFISGSPAPFVETTQAHLHQIGFEVSAPSETYAQLASGSAASWVFDGITYSRHKMEDGFQYSSNGGGMQRIVRVGMKTSKPNVFVVTLWD